MEEIINIKELVQTLKKRWKLIVLLTLSAGLISGAITYYVLTPVYQASTQILVNQTSSNNQVLDVNQVQTNLELINTYSSIIKSPVILEKVIDKLDLTQSVEDLNKKIKVNSQENSQVFSLTVEDNDPAKATKIVNTVSETFQTEIKDIMNVDNVRILAKAKLQENPIAVKPNPVLNIVMALVIGLMASIGLSFLLRYTDNTIKNDLDIEKDLGLSVLGSIQKITEDQEEGSKKQFARRMGGETLES